MLIISGLKCDHCDYRDDSVPYSDYPVSIGRPCPNCNESLLTQEDFDDCEKIMRQVARIQKVMHHLRWFNPFFYLRLIFGDKRNEYTLRVKMPNRKQQSK